MRIQFFATSAFALLCSACGGGGSGDPAGDSLTAVPPSASQSTQGMISYLGDLRPLDAEGREPVPLNGFEPPTSETDEPQDVGD
jgi:hypothetical protein